MVLKLYDDACLVVGWCDGIELGMYGGVGGTGGVVWKSGGEVGRRMGAVGVVCYDSVAGSDKEVGWRAGCGIPRS